MPTGLDVTIRVVDDNADAAAIRREIARNLATSDDYVLVNYARKSLGQPGGGHISPLGAYDEASDSLPDHGRQSQPRALGVGEGGRPDRGDAHLRYRGESRLPADLRRELDGSRAGTQER